MNIPVTWCERSLEDEAHNAPPPLAIRALSNRLNCVFIAIKNESWIGQKVHGVAINGTSYLATRFRSVSIGRTMVVSADIECGGGGGGRTESMSGGGGGTGMNSNVKQKHRVTNGVYSRRHCFKWLSDARNLSRFATWQAPLNLFIHPRKRVACHIREIPLYLQLPTAGRYSTGERGSRSTIMSDSCKWPGTIYICTICHVMPYVVTLSWFLCIQRDIELQELLLLLELLELRSFSDGREALCRIFFRFNTASFYRKTLCGK